MPYGGAGGQRLRHCFHCFAGCYVWDFIIFLTSFITMLSLISFLWNLLFVFVFLFEILTHSLSGLALKEVQKEIIAIMMFQSEMIPLQRRWVVGHSIHPTTSMTIQIFIKKDGIL